MPNFDVFLRDRIVGATSLVSVNSSGTGSSVGSSLLTSMDATGNQIVFVSDANDIVSNDSNNARDVFVRNIENNATTLVSVNTSGQSSGNASSEFGLISGDGHSIAFQSSASDLVTGDNNESTDVFVLDLENGTTEIASRTSDGQRTGNAASTFPAFGYDGSVLTYLSDANDLVESDWNADTDIFIRDLAGLQSELLIVANDQFRSASAGGRSGLEPGIAGLNTAVSEDGRYIVFESEAHRILFPTLSFSIKVRCVAPTCTATTAGLQEMLLLSVAPNGLTDGNGRSIRPSISADGNVIVFLSLATNLDVGGTIDTNDSYDLFARSVSSGETQLITVDSSGRAIGEFGSTGDWAMSRNGQVVAFSNRSPDLLGDGTADENSQRDVFVRDLISGTTTLASVSMDGQSTGDGDSSSVSVSDDGRLIGFSSRANDLVDDESDFNSDVFVFDRNSEIIQKVSVDLDLVGDADSFRPIVSGDGSSVVFVVASSVNSPLQIYDLYRRDLDSDVTQIITNRIDTPADEESFFRALNISQNGQGDFVCDRVWWLRA